MLSSFCKYAPVFDSRCKRYSFYVIIVFALFCSLYITSRSYGPSSLMSIDRETGARTEVEDPNGGEYESPQFAAVGMGNYSLWSPSVSETQLQCVSFDDMMSDGQRYRFDINGSDVLVFLHIQKTAGTTFERYLVRQLNLPQPCQCWPKRKRCTCLRPSGSGHWLFSRFSTGWNCGLHADWTELITSGCVDKFLNRREKRVTRRRYFISTMLREPVARFISEFKHVQRGATWQATPHFCNGRPPSSEEMPPCFNPEVGWEGVSLEEFLNCSSNFGFNRMTRMLSDLTTVGCYSRSLLDPNSRSALILESAKNNLRKMAFFGLQEDMRRSQYVFEELFSLRFNKPMVNQMEQSDPAEFTVTQLEHIRNANRLDIEIYNFARQLFYKRFQLLKAKDSFYELNMAV
ncbi:unnamed protein product [Soboliphyme baturini]|uniref:Heparan-sulfate 6-O-sulfotransferase n=1 Tax=Soboliphyme baturini TaxID=241478 RepID=A0A183IU13_9BILA|nr:unnamed protein product [Soboliphyme baturini]